MSMAFWREKVLAGMCCLLGMGACRMMWHEAGLDQPRRQLHYFGGSRRVPFWQQQYPESKFLFTGLCYGIVILSLLGLINQRDRQPEYFHGPAFILLGVFFGFMHVQARTVTGVPFSIVQPGFCLAMAANGGLVVAGAIVLVRAARGQCE